MKFVTLRDLRNKTAAIRKGLETERQMVLTANGRPVAILAHADEETLEAKLAALRRAEARELFGRIRAHAKARGPSRWTMREIDAEIARYRHERRERS